VRSARNGACALLASLGLATPLVVAATGGGADEPTTSEPTTTAPETDWQARAQANAREAHYWKRHAHRYRGWVLRLRASLKAMPSPVSAGLRCVHLGEGAWSANTGNGYFGGLQMDRHFQATYGAPLLRRYGSADRWPVEAQLAVGTIAVYSGRGFGPWPNTRRPCGL
jgi:hypothetical protein